MTARSRLDTVASSFYEELEAELPVSVCIAAMSIHDNEIVTVSDRMISTALGEVTAENAALKQGFICQNWFVLYSGNDVGCVGPILRSAMAKMAWTGNYTPDDVRRIMVDAYNAERRARATADILGIYGLTMEQFLAEGLAKFGSVRFEQVCQRIDSMLLDVDFLVAGFDVNGRPHVFTLLTGTPNDYDMAGYWAIGSGARLALAALAALNQGIFTRTNQTIYNLCAARFVASAAHGVGRGETILAVQKKDEEVRLAMSDLIADVKTHWEAHTRVIPQPALDAIDAWLTPIAPRALEGPAAEPEVHD